MNPFKLFNEDPNPIVIKEFPERSGIFHIPIEEVKIMLWDDFKKWDTERFQFRIDIVGESTFVSGSVELVLYPHDNSDAFRFTGSCTYNASANPSHSPIDVNDNYAGTVLAECIKNAAKNLGRKYGMFLNSKNIVNKNLEKVDYVNNAINTILKKK